MSNSIAMDLTAVRKKSGLTQKDCAHLLDIDNSKICNMEAGRVVPTLEELCTLSLVFGRSLESLASGMFADIRKALPERLATLPVGSRRWLTKFNRNNTLNKIEARLRTLDEVDRGAA